jgi:hypothetical protein
VANFHHEISLRSEQSSFSLPAPRLLEAECGTVEQMQLVSALCALPEYGET